MTSIEVGDAEKGRRLLAVIFEYVGDTGSQLLDQCEEFVKELTDQLDEQYPQFVPCPVCGAIYGDPCLPVWSMGETDGVWHDGRVDVEATLKHIDAPPLDIDCPTCWAAPKEPCVRGAAGSQLWDKHQDLGRNHDARIMAYREEEVKKYEA